MKLKAWSPTREILKDPQIMMEGIARAFSEGDQEAFNELLQGWIAALQARYTMEELTKKTGVSRRSLYNLTRPDANPTIGTLLGLVKATKKAA